jgi:hypothetical protein
MNSLCRVPRQTLPNPLVVSGTSSLLRIFKAVQLPLTQSIDLDRVRQASRFTLAAGVHLLFRILGPTMQALPITNAATISQALPFAAGAPVPVAAPDNPADSAELPSFAQVIREILVRTTTQDATQPAHTSRSNGSAISVSSDSPLPAPPHGTPSQFPQLLDPATLSLLAFLSQPTLVQPLLPTPPAASSTQTPPVTKPCDSATSPVSAVASAPQSGSPCSTNVAPIATTPTPLSTTPLLTTLPIATPTTLPLSPPTLEMQPPDIQSESITNSLVTFTFTSPSLKQNAVADPSQPNDNNQPTGPNTETKKPVDLEVVSNMPATLAGIPISSLTQQIASLQPVAPTNVYTSVVPSSATPHFAASQSNAKTTPVSAPSVTSLPMPEAAPLSSSKSAPLVHAETQPAVPCTNSSSMNQSTSQDNSSNNLDAQKPASPSTTPNTTTSHDTSSFAQALVNAGNANAKPDAVLAATNQQPVALPVSTPSNERLTQPATAAQPAAPQANPPQTALRSLDTAPTPAITDAQISQSTGHSEMRIAMQTDKFGAVELHTRVAGDEIGAAITVEKRDAHAALAVELPALQQALSEKQLRVDQITLLHGPLHSTTGDPGSQPQSHGQQGDRRAPRAPSMPFFVPDSGSAFSFSQTVTEPSGIFDSRGRLSVQA